ncbi:MAG: hypothetical protein HY608_11840 [Planctomycetes bacterium]|nr:hypothetical protein [Planctomycetota bacterium]
MAASDAGAQAGRSPRRVGILVVVLLLSVGYAARYLHGHPPTPSGDGLGYHGLARNLLTRRTFSWAEEGHAFVPVRRICGQPCTDRAPLHPFVIAVLLAIRPSHAFVGAVYAGFWCLGNALLTLLLLDLVEGAVPIRRLLIPFAMGLAVFSSSVLVHATTYYRQPLEYLLIHGLAWTGVRALREGPSAGRTTLLGALIALAALLQPSFLALFPLLIVAAIAWARMGHGHLARHALAAAGCAALLISPWTIRNYVQSGVFVPVSSLTGLNLMTNAGEGSGNQTHRIYPSLDGQGNLLTRREKETLSDAAADRLIFRRKIVHLVHHPGVALRVLAKNVCLTLYPIRSDTGRWHTTFGFLLLALLPMLGRGKRAHPLCQGVAWLWCIVLAAFALPSVVFIASPLYRVPFEGLMLVLATRALAGWFARAPDTRARERRAMLATALATINLSLYWVYTPSVRESVKTPVLRLLNSMR